MPWSNFPFTQSHKVCITVGYIIHLQLSISRLPNVTKRWSWLASINAVHVLEGQVNSEFSSLRTSTGNSIQQMYMWERGNQNNNVWIMTRQHLLPNHAVGVPLTTQISEHSRHTTSTAWLWISEREECKLLPCAHDKQREETKKGLCYTYRIVSAVTRSNSVIHFCLRSTRHLDAHCRKSAAELVACSGNIIPLDGWDKLGGKICFDKQSKTNQLLNR